MRTDKGIKNGIVAILCNLITIVVTFVAQSIFIDILGNEYNGLNGLFSNIISMLGVVELGLGSALIYHLYEPIAKKNISKIKSLMRYYRNGYRVIAGIIALLSLLIMPLLHFFVSTELDINIYLVFALFAAESVVSYSLSYKRSILYASQKNYIINVVKIGYIIILNVSQILMLLYTHDFYLYLIIKIVARILENAVITLIANKKYSYIRDKDVEELDKEVKKDVFKKIRGLFNHKIGSYIVLGTDNIIISKFLDLGTVGLYTNYTLIVNGIVNLFSQIFYSLTAVVGNLLVEKDSQKSYAVYKNMNFINFVLACVGSIGFYFVSKPFMEMWLGDDFILNNITIFVLMMKLYFDIYGYTIGAFKTAGGIFYEDRFVPIIQSVINIVVSIGLVMVVGLPGVILGTVASSLLLYFYSYPKLVYEKLFNRKYSQYMHEFLLYFMVLITVFLIVSLMDGFIIVDNVFVSILVKIFESTFIPLMIVFLAFRKTSECKYMEKIVKKILKIDKKKD